jgi:hypothetical protein
LREEGVVRGLLVVSALVMFGGVLVVSCGVLVMFGSLVMVFSGALDHEDLLQSRV